ncbi:MAG: protein kinase domain-containing protein [Elainellaceae cyanobacterium]
MTASVEKSPKKLIDNRYQIQRLLGQGGFGRTYLVQDERRFGESCVLKEFAPGDSNDATVTQKLSELFRREAKILHKLDHPQIPKFLAWFQDRGRLFIVQEYVDGKTYWQILQERKQYGKTFTEAEVIRWLKDLLPVVGYIHDQNIIHRDISPDNVMLPKGKDFPVLIDFGVVKPTKSDSGQETDSSDDESSMEASVLVGKYGYAPYEQIYMGQCSPRSDLYALGVSAVVLLTGRKPNQLIHPSTLKWIWQERISIDSRLVQILNKMMAKEPQDRYPSARAVLADLQQLELSPQGAHLDSFAQPSLRQSVSRAVNALKTSDVHESRHNSSHSSPPPVGAQVEWALDNAVSNQVHETVPQTILESPIATTSDDASLLSLQDWSPLQKGQRLLTTAFQYLVHFEQPRWKYAALSLTAVSLLAAGLAGVQTAQNDSWCWLSGNCLSQETLVTSYEEAVDRAKSALADAEGAETLKELISAGDRLQTAIDYLGAIPSDADIYPQVEESLASYRRELTDLENRIETELPYAALLSEAEALAQAAEESLETATAIQDQVDAKRFWEDARLKVKAIPSSSLAYDIAAERLQDYQARIEGVNRIIAQGQQSGSIQDPDGSSQPPSPEQVVSSLPTSPSSNAIRPPVQRSPSQTSPQRSPQPVERSSPRVSQPPPSPTRSSASGAVPLLAAQNLDDVSVRLDGAHVNTSGTFVANVVIENQSDRTFAFVPVYAARIETEWGQPITSRISFGNSSEPVVERGDRLTGQLFVLGQRWKDSGSQNLVLVIEEGTTGGRTFRIPF